MRILEYLADHCCVVTRTDIHLNIHIPHITLSSLLKQSLLSIIQYTESLRSAGLTKPGSLAQLRCHYWVISERE